MDEFEVLTYLGGGEYYQISRLLRRPYSPASFNSASKRAASNGLYCDVSIY
jgi:hypothetical protein